MENSNVIYYTVCLQVDYFSQGYFLGTVLTTQMIID